MAPPHATASPTPGLLGDSRNRNRVAEALYQWCLDNYEIGKVLVQQELLGAGIVPNDDLHILLDATNFLVERSFLRLHDTKQGSGLGWELVSQEKAANLKGLTRDEAMVYHVIDSVGNQGIWTKTIKARLGIHNKVLEGCYKTLERVGLIKLMKSVKFPNRKMYIIAGLQPSEEATGGAWYSDGQLDQGLMEIVSTLIEFFVSSKSWQEDEADDPAREEAQHPETHLSAKNKRRAPADGFDREDEPRHKNSRLDDNAPRSESPELRHKTPKPQPPRKTYSPFPPGHRDYPTVANITEYITKSTAIKAAIPQPEIAKLLDVMVYDDRLFKMTRAPIGDEHRDPDSENVTMYRCFATPFDLAERNRLAKRLGSNHDRTRKAAERQKELDGLGRGGASEVPCMQCPVFDICGDGGPVNVKTCQYFEPWYARMEAADLEVGIDWQNPRGHHTHADAALDGKGKGTKRGANGGPAITAEYDRVEDNDDS